MKFLESIIIVLICMSCASRGVSITSSTPSRIEINGETVCSTTPCEKSGVCWKHGVPMHVEAFPLDKTKGYTQKKDVGSAECVIFSSNMKHIFFEMDSRPGIAIEKSEVEIKAGK